LQKARQGTKLAGDSLSNELRERKQKEEKNQIPNKTQKDWDDLQESKKQSVRRGAQFT